MIKDILKDYGIFATNQGIRKRQSYKCPYISGFNGGGQTHCGQFDSSAPPYQSPPLKHCHHLECGRNKDCINNETLKELNSERE